MKKVIDNSQLLARELIKKSFEENLQENNEEVPTNESEYRSSLNSYFEIFTSGLILKQFDLSDEELENGIVGGGNDGGCDSLYLFLNEELVLEDTAIDVENVKRNPILDVYIIQSKFEKSFREDVFYKWKNVIENLLSLEVFQSRDFLKRYNEKVINFFERFHELYVALITKSPTVNFRFFYASLGNQVHPNVQEQAHETENKLREIYPSKNTLVKIEFVGSKELLDLFNAPSKTDFILHVSETPIIVEEGKQYIVLTKLGDFYNFITNENKKLIKHIFESNVRDYQGNVTVNKEIAETLRNRQSIEDFWWLNNGITMLASSIDQKSTKVFEIKNPEIVNGLQTSTEIYNYFSSGFEPSLEERKVLIRIIVPDGEESRDKIILATNSQTNIPKAILRGTDSIHREIETYFKTKDLYYDRRKNYYKNLGKPKSKIISISFLAQCLISILLKKPDYARARPSTLLKDEKTYEYLYLKNIYMDSFYNAAKIGLKVKSFIRSLGRYDSSVQSDILFYVIYLLTAKIIGSKDITPKQLSQTNLKKYTDEKIEECTEFVYEMYMKLGGNNKVAKGSKLKKSILESEFIRKPY